MQLWNIILALSHLSQQPLLLMESLERENHIFFSSAVLIYCLTRNLHVSMYC